MDYQTQAPWDRPQIFAYNNSMMASQADQQEPSYPVDPLHLHWIANLEPAFRDRSHPESQQQEWAAAAAAAQTLEPAKASSSFGNNMQNRQGQQHYSSYQEAHQNTYQAPQQVLASNLSYGPSSAASFNHWAPSPGADSRDSSVLSPRSERDYRQDPSLVSSPYAAHALTRSHSGISALSHEAELYGGGQQFQQQTIPNMSMIHPELDEDPTFRGQEEMFMDHESGEQDTSSNSNTLAPRPTQLSQFLHPHLSPAPSIHRHLSPALSTYNNTLNPPAPRLTPHQTPIEVDDTDLDAPFDLDSPLPRNDDTDTDETWTPHAARRTSRTPRRRQPRRAAPPARVIHPSSTTCVRKPGGRANNPTSSSSAGRPSNANPTFPCTFAWAGCTSAFASKNEWKRHVASKHTCFFYWECRVGSCSAPGQAGKFNRKDLFAQHLRRMHAPPSSSSTAKSGPAKEAWEKRLAGLLEEGKRKGRAQIMKVACPVLGCGVQWEGQRAWDERMEHVARHWEGGRGGEVGWCESEGGL
ncbi:hypothetical protein VE02_03596 [Pseudogymnoascus sp. 03VT05]|nr:hypothetical protein VE02_03596 [Pseudogymnoascus sp. 03VT05]